MEEEGEGEGEEDIVEEAEVEAEAMAVGEGEAVMEGDRRQGQSANNRRQEQLRNRRSRHRSNRMKIAELKPGMRRVDVKGKIVDVESPREVQTKFGPGQVASATLQDESGSVKVTLWNENISKVAVNDTIEIQNGYVDSFRGELQLNVGRYGKLAKVE